MGDEIEIEECDLSVAGEYVSSPAGREFGPHNFNDLAMFAAWLRANKYVTADRDGWF